MQRSKPENTKLTICVWHPFTQWRPTPAMPETLRLRWPTMKVVHLPEYKHLAEELTDTDILVGYSPRPEQLVDAPKLKWIHSPAAGVAQLGYPELRDSGIVVTNPSGLFSVPMAGHTMGLLLALNFPDSVRHQEHSHWGRQEIWDQPWDMVQSGGNSRGAQRRLP
jgi:phosphoglycerate dehydrogenase-like enzyme